MPYEKYTIHGAGFDEERGVWGVWEEGAVKYGTIRLVFRGKKSRGTWYLRDMGKCEMRNAKECLDRENSAIA